MHQSGFGRHLDSVNYVLVGGRTVTVCNVVVDLVRFELTTSSMPWKRAPNCATGPRGQLYYYNIRGARFRLAGAGAVRDCGLRHRQNRANAVGVADVEQHPLRQHAAHFARFQVHHE
jgi:hypothetical protein